MHGVLPLSSLTYWLPQTLDSLLELLETGVVSLTVWTLLKDYDITVSILSAKSSHAIMTLEIYLYKVFCFSEHFQSNNGTPLITKNNQ